MLVLPVNCRDWLMLHPFSLLQHMFSLLADRLRGGSQELVTWMPYVVACCSGRRIPRGLQFRLLIAPRFPACALVWNVRSMPHCLLQLTIFVYRTPLSATSSW